MNGLSVGGDPSAPPPPKPPFTSPPEVQEAVKFYGRKLYFRSRSSWLAALLKRLCNSTLIGFGSGSKASPF